MPRPGLPPTPASSTDIRGKNDHQLQTLDTFCALPPPAMTSANHSASSNASDKSDSSYRPVSPTSPTSKSSTSKPKRPADSKNAMSVASSNFSLPQPPTRSRRIIQMNPGASQDSKPSVVTTTSTSVGKKAVSVTTHSLAAAQKRQPSATSVAGRKIARKTAHSLIERRRRSKMNEEFGMLKNMIPACHGQEMHKLAILQASIDYLRYLEQCIVDLKSANAEHRVFATDSGKEPSRIRKPQVHSSSWSKQSEGEEEDDDDDDNDENEGEGEGEMDIEAQDQDQEMVDYPPKTTTTPTTCHFNSSSLTSPSLYASHTNNVSPTIYADHSHAYCVPIIPQPPSTSALPSPAFSPSHQDQASFIPTTPCTDSIKYTHSSYRSSTRSSITSPALLPQVLDVAHAKMEIEKQEATAALLMLNRDRRASGGAAMSPLPGTSGREIREQRSGARGMSVRDLLSS